MAGIKNQKQTNNLTGWIVISVVLVVFSFGLLLLPIIIAWVIWICVRQAPNTSLSTTIEHQASRVADKPARPTETLWYIYLLTPQPNEPQNWHLWYVGQTKNPTNRFRDHASHQSASRITQSYLQAGCQMAIRVLAICRDQADADRWEAHWVNQLNTYSHGLNRTPHGQGYAPRQFVAVGNTTDDVIARRITEFS